MNATSRANELLIDASQRGLIATLKQFGNGLRFRIPIAQSFWDSSIDELNLSVRSRNGLMRARATTIGETSELIMHEGGLEAVRNLGRKSISEIKTAILVEAYNRLSPKAQQTFWEFFLENN